MEVQLSFAEFIEMVDTGQLEAKGEYIGGIFYPNMPTSAEHSNTVAKIITELHEKSLHKNYLLKSENSIIFGEDVLSPDISVLSGYDKRSKTLPKSEHVKLLIEVSLSSLRFDINTKVSIYASFNIEEYWIVDLNSDVSIET
ncbi:unnamed protein product [Didymodactylos carnosus]|uniref:Putative restriction endonuclease domain-containing protein n=1 Tax=Didymodactylos carnosus TaxID=1234261 RepID=A0A814WWN9_9BILA|nr:unnamed protein product [Didymodactylos carnosus]CAF1211296.1 unnamed protein product [Didymodactylos carnosus]CAF3511041.1 unnamed protein product [Didymodactylos carnosus]CAF3975262.1 unnamed protein product [Didymodactylos carnosus]